MSILLKAKLSTSLWDFGLFFGWVAKGEKTDNGSGRLKICTGKVNEKDTNGGRC